MIQLHKLEVSHAGHEWTQGETDVNFEIDFFRKTL